jgi:hypothetical protein
MSTLSRYAIITAAAALLVGCGGSQPIGTPGAMPQISPIRVTPDKHEKNDVVGVYGSPDYSSTINGYKGTDPKNGPPICSLKAAGMVNDIAVDSKGNLIVPEVTAYTRSIGDTTVYEGPKLCGRKLGSVQDNVSKSAPSDVASLNAATGTIAVANGYSYTFYEQGSISVCTLKGGCTRNLTNPNMHFVVGVALAKDGDCWATGRNYDSKPVMIYFKGCKGSGQLAAGWKNVAPGGLDIDAKGNIVSVDASAAELWIYRGCNPACTVVGGPFALNSKSRTTYGHLNSAGTEFIAGNYVYSGGLDIYKYSTKGLTYERSITNGLMGSTAAAFDLGSRE